MGNKHAHVEKAQRNEAALSRFNFEPDLYEWYITVSFTLPSTGCAPSWPWGPGTEEEVHYDQFPHQVREVYRAHFGQNAQAAETALNAFQIIKNCHSGRGTAANLPRGTPAKQARQTPP